MACATPCRDCDQKGLPILFTRYAAAYSAQPEGLAALRQLQPSGNLQARPGGVAISTALYNLRMLRAGYLYVRIERVGLAPEWTGYAVHPQGYLSRFEVRFPQNAKPNPACEVEIRGAISSMVWVADACSVKKLDYLFHPDPIDPAHLMDTIDANRAKYMQSFDVKAWVGGNHALEDTIQLEQLNSAVMEFAAIGDKAVQKVGCEQHFGLMGRTPQEREWGSYQEIKVGPHFGETAGGAATGPAVGVHTETVLQLPYAAAHGPRLKKMAQMLQDHKGAVVACDDAIGIAQEISLHHLTAAIPYMDWLKATDAKGVSNQWKQAASESIRAVAAALARKVVEAYDDSTDVLRNTQEVLAGSYPGSDTTQSVRLRRSDGSYEEVSLAELNRRRQADLAQRIAERETGRSQTGIKLANDDALRNVSRYCDMSAIEAFDAAHKAQLQQRDELMDKLALDLQAWLKADALLNRSLNRYNEHADIDTGDGARCAGQLCAILLQVDSAPRGRQWYAGIDLFIPSHRNLVWRMLSLNNAAISAELQAALEQVSAPLPPGGLEVSDAQQKARYEKACATVLAALTQLNKTLSATDKINSGMPKVMDSGLKRFDRLRAAGELAKVIYDSPHAVLGAATMARFKGLPATQGETLIAKAQVMLMARGLGQHAVALTKTMQADSLNKGLTKQARSTQRQIEKAIERQIGEVAGQQMRLPNILLALNTLAILPALANANSKRDERTTTELLATLAGLVGSMRQWRADLYEKALFKQLPEMVYKTHKAGTAGATEAQLLGLKTGAAHFVVAGAVVGVAWDAADAVTAGREKDTGLAWTYAGRVASGAGAVFGVVAGARYITAPLWLARFNFVTLVVTGALTVAIGKLKGEAWTNWLKAQPFRSALIRDDDTKSVRVENRSVQPMSANAKLPHESEKETMDKLADVLVDLN